MINLCINGESLIITDYCKQAVHEACNVGGHLKVAFSYIV